MRGRVKFFVPDKADPRRGWGFIEVDDDDEGADLHFTQRDVCYSPVLKGDEVEFSIRENKPVRKGRTLAARSIRRAETQ